MTGNVHSAFANRPDETHGNKIVSRNHSAWPLGKAKEMAQSFLRDARIEGSSCVDNVGIQCDPVLFKSELITEKSISRCRDARRSVNECDPSMAATHEKSDQIRRSIETVTCDVITLVCTRMPVNENDRT